MESHSRKRNVYKVCLQLSSLHRTSWVTHLLSERSQIQTKTASLSSMLVILMHRTCRSAATLSFSHLVNSHFLDLGHMKGIFIPQCL